MLNKAILIIEPSTSGYALITTAKRLGCFVMVMSADSDERVIPEEYKSFIDQMLIVDTNKLDAIYGLLSKLVRKPEAVIPGFEIYVDIAAHVAAYLNLPHVGLSTVRALRDKAEMRDMLHSKGIRIPDYWRINELTDIDDAANDFRFPVVLKPIDQSGSVHVSKVASMAELKAAYIAMCADPWAEMNKGIGKHALVESYIDGKEYSVEGYLDQGQMRIVSITEKTTTAPPYFIEMRHVVSANLDEKEIGSVHSYIQNVIEALELNMGVFHAEIKIDNDGPVLIEIAGRLAGDKICDLILLAHGVDLREVMLYSHLNVPAPFIQQTSTQFAGIQYFSLSGDVYHEAVSIEAMTQLPGYYDAKVFYEPGEIVPPLQSFEGRVGYCILTAVSYDVLIDRLDDVKRMVRFV